MARRILVTGASGFIGRHVVESLVSSGAQIVAVGRHPPHTYWPGVTWISVDCLDSGAPQIIAASKADTLVHLAWTVEHGHFWNAPENLDWTAATLHLTRAFAAAGGRRIVGVGTCFEYDVATAIVPMNERADLPKPATLYGNAKDATRRLLEAFGKQASLEVAWARPFHLYGPHEDARRLVASVAINLLKGEPAACSSGHQQRDFMHVADAGAAVAALALSRVTGPVNIASGELTTVGEIARRLGDLAHRPDLIRIGDLPDRPGDPHCILADIGRLSGEVGFAPKFSLASGLADALGWQRHELGRNSTRTDET